MKKYSVVMRPIALLCAVIGAISCAQTAVQNPTAVSGSSLTLTRAVLYQNGVGYFERQGTVEGDQFTVRIRADQVNDFLKSLTVIDSSDGKAVSVSLPLDRSAAAHVMELAEQLKGDISLPKIIALLKGTEISLTGKKTGTISGRLLSVEPWTIATEASDTEDYLVAVLGDNAVQTILLSDLTALTIRDDFITLGLHKGLDAAAVGGVFKVVDVVVHLDRPKTHEILVSYVVECPAWKPTYRLVLGEDKDVLLQGWAVVDNVTGEGWNDISLSLTSGAPLAFRYDLYSPKFVNRPDLSATADQKVARAAVGEASFDAEKEEAPALEANEDMYEESEREASPSGGHMKKMKSKPSPRIQADRIAPAPRMEAAFDDIPSPKPAPAVSMDSLHGSVQSMVKASSASGAVRYDMTLPVSVPDRSSTLVSILNHKVVGEEVFLYTPQGGAGQGYEQNPYRVVRFRNTTGFMLEPGPISIYSSGTFVGEGIAETISDGKQAVIPFAVDASILVTVDRTERREGARLLRIFNRQLWVESFDRIKTAYKIKGGDGKGFRVYARHRKAGGDYTFKNMPKGTEDVGDAYLIPIDAAPGAKETVYIAVEQTPVTRTLSIWDTDALTAAALLLNDEEALSPETRQTLKKVLEMTAEVGKIDIEISHLDRRRWEIDQRMAQTRENLKALKKNKAAAGLKAKLAESLGDMAKEGDTVTKQIVTLTDRRSALAVSVDQLIGEISLNN